MEESMNWTDDQRDAIFSRGQDLLLSAAAGSGKTTVLVERVLTLIGEGADIDQFLIVTFSRAAAADMRRKLTEELTDRAEGEARFAAQLEKAEHAAISTIHSFCADLLREHFESAGVDPQFRVLDAGELAQLEAQALSDAMEQAYAQGGSKLDALCFGRTAKHVGQLALDMHAFSLENPDPEAWLNAACHQLPLSDGALWLDELARAARRSLSDARAMTAYASALCDDPEGPSAYKPMLDEDLTALDAMIAAPDYASLEARVLAYAPPALKAIRKPKDGASQRWESLKAQAQALRKGVKKLLDDVKKLLLPMERGLSDVRLLAPALGALGDIASLLGENLAQLKDERSALSYSDLEHKALHALKDERVAASLRARYRYVFVDEYQDVSGVQEAILRAVSPDDRLFMVGDVKQSIYRFRQADPSLFLEKYRLFGQGRGGKLVSLKQNFRSRPAILQLVNRVFEKIMTGADAEIDYDDAARLRPGAAFEGDDPPVEVHILEKPDEDALPSGEAELSNAEREGAVIAARIADLVGSPCYDARAKRVRPLEYRDFVVLVRTRAPIPAIERMLTRAGIPAYADIAGGYFDALEVELALCLIGAVDNRRRDLELISALRSPAGGLDTKDLAAIRRCHPSGSFRDAMLHKMQSTDALGETLRGFEAKLDRWRELSRVLPLGRLVDLILRESGYYVYAGGMPGGAGRQANLDLLCDYAEKYESAQGGSLSGFLNYVRKVRVSGDDMGTAHTLGEDDQVVRLMTVHKSKGLEFPVVLAAQMGRKFGAAPGRGELATHRALGAGLRLTDPALGSRRETLPRAAIEARLSLEDYNEEMRVLYVMLTRAIDRMILIGRVNARADAQTRFALCAQAGLRPASFLEAVAPAAQSMGDGCRILWTAAAADEPGPPPRAAEPPALQDAALRDAILWQYPHKERVMLPLKLTVSALAREVTGPRALPPMGKRPMFMSDDDPRALEYGTLTHNALMGMDLGKLRGLSRRARQAEVARQLAALRASGRLYGDVEPGLIARFFERPTGQRLLAAQRVEREWPFILRHDENDERLLVQGVIDCCFIEDGQWILLDYKTDRTRDLDALRDRYRPQIDWYARALHQITGIPVRQRLICLLRAGVELAV
jgi:ATP-dependent helicase/nuclease subunit A